LVSETIINIRIVFTQQHNGDITVKYNMRKNIYENLITGGGKLKDGWNKKAHD
jgi:hypothetical protein